MEEKALLIRCYLAIRVLYTMFKYAGLNLAKSRAEELLQEIKENLTFPEQLSNLEE